MLRARVRSISVPPTFHIASLNRHTPKFSGATQKLTWKARLSIAESFSASMSEFKEFFNTFKSVSFGGGRRIAAHIEMLAGSREARWKGKAKNCIT